MYHSWIKVCYNFHRQHPLKKKKLLFLLPKQDTGQYPPTYVSLSAQLAQLMCHSSTNNVLTNTIKKTTYYVGMADA